jgi:hypothetical protein
MQYLFLFHSNHGYTKAPQCYVINTLPVLVWYHKRPQRFLGPSQSTVQFKTRALLRWQSDRRVITHLYPFTGWERIVCFEFWSLPNKDMTEYL